MKKHFQIVLLIVSAALLSPHALFAQETAKNNGIAIISVPLANVHEEPVPKSALVTQVLLGDEVRSLKSATTGTG